MPLEKSKNVKPKRKRVLPFEQRKESNIMIKQMVKQQTNKNGKLTGG
jgi:hypothetical protein